MGTIINQYIDGNMQVIEYDSGTIVKIPVQSETPPGETLPVPPTFEQRLKTLEEATNVLLGLK